MTISTEVMTHVLVFHDKTYKYITQDQYNLIMQGSATDRKSISTPKLGTIFFSSIARIPTIEDYYEQFPDERPDYRPEIKIDAKPDYNAKLHANQMKLLMAGLKRFIDENEAKQKEVPYARKLYTSWQRKEISLNEAMQALSGTVPSNG